MRRVFFQSWRFRSRMPVEECNDNLSKFKKTASEFFGLTEACQRHGLGDFLKLFRLSNLSKESYAVQTQFQWNTERDPLTSDSDQNELEINTDGDRTVDTL